MHWGKLLVFRQALEALALMASPLAANQPLCFHIDGPYALIGRYGQIRAKADPESHAQLIVFGNANCLNICSAASPVIPGVVDSLAAWGIALIKVMIIVASDQAHLETMGAPLEAIYRNFQRNRDTDTELPEKNCYALLPQDMYQQRLAVHRKVVVHTKMKATIEDRFMADRS